MNRKSEKFDSKKHQKSDFECGQSSLDDYIRFQASQDVRKGLAVCYVLPDEDYFIKSYYTLSSASIPQEDIPEKFRKRFPKTYVNVPVTLIGRLAVDKKYQGENLGRVTLIEALRHSFQASQLVASNAVVVDLLNEDVGGFYARLGFEELPDRKKMFLPMKTVEKIVSHIE